MKRREFLAGIGLSGYSLVVLADESTSGTAPQLPERPDARLFERIAPPGAEPPGSQSTAGNEPHMVRVPLECDVLVAGGGLAGVCAAIAAALCAKSGLEPRHFAQNQAQVAGLQQTLLRDDQTIKGRRNLDPLDLARQAKVSASAEHDDSPAANVTNGYSRAVPGKATNRWATEVTADGTWIELAWDKPQKLSTVQLTFDTGFQRELTLTSSDAINKGIIRAPQPETVRDYSLSYRAAEQGPLTSLLEIQGNHQRQNRPRFAPIEAQAIRIRVTATNGDPLTRIFEVRCYS
jgi:hypothetical protein